MVVNTRLWLVISQARLYIKRKHHPSSSSSGSLNYHHCRLTFLPLQLRLANLHHSKSTSTVYTRQARTAIFPKPKEEASLYQAAPLLKSGSISSVTWPEKRQALFVFSRGGDGGSCQELFSFDEIMSQQQYEGVLIKREDWHALCRDFNLKEPFFGRRSSPEYSSGLLTQFLHWGKCWNVKHQQLMRNNGSITPPPPLYIKLRGL